jgi:glucan-binding YG repeat protein
VTVTDGSSNNLVSQTTVERTLGNDGTKKDNINYAENKAQQTVDALKKEGNDVARILIPDVKDEVSETKVNIPTATIAVLASGNINLEIDTENARISLPKESIQDLSQKSNGQVNGELYFRLVPIKDEIKQEEIKTRANQEQVIKNVSGNNGIQVLGRPMTIETNMSQRAVDITLPLKGVTIPNSPADREAFLKDLGIFIEHSDGEKVFARGEIVEYAPGVLGIKFRINKFSSFTIVKLNQETAGTGTWQSNTEGWKYIKSGQPVTGWNQISGYWYLMDSTGVMQTGWKQTNGTWYLLKNDGAMATGWQQTNGEWYYLYSDGAMASNIVIDGYILDKSGAWVK